MLCVLSCKTLFAVPPLLAYGLPKVQTQEGRTVRLRCQVLLGSPWPKLTWYKDGEIVQDSNRVRFVCTIVITVV